jgi:nitrogen regulatory protein PII
MFMVMFVLDDPNRLDEVLKAWMDAGILGATITESTGMRKQLTPCPPMRYSYGGSNLREAGNLTLFVIVKNETLVNKCLAAAEEVMGDLNNPNTGVFAAWPLSITKGIPGECGDGGNDGMG